MPNTAQIMDHTNLTYYPAERTNDIAKYLWRQFYQIFCERCRVAAGYLEQKFCEVCFIFLCVLIYFYNLFTYLFQFKNCDVNFVVIKRCKTIFCSQQLFIY